MEMFLFLFLIFRLINLGQGLTLQLRLNSVPELKLGAILLPQPPKFLGFHVWSAIPRLDDCVYSSWEKEELPGRDDHGRRAGS